MPKTNTSAPNQHPSIARKLRVVSGSCGQPVDSALACLCLNIGGCTQAVFEANASSAQASTYQQFVQVLCATFSPTYTSLSNLLKGTFRSLYTAPTIRATTLLKI